MKLLKLTKRHGTGIAFGLSHLLGEKMRLSHQHLPAIQSNLHSTTPSAYLVTRCPASSSPQLNQNHICTCGPTESAGASLCPGEDLTSGATTICIEDLREGKRAATCGIEFLAFSLDSADSGDSEEGEEEGDAPRCPEGFQRLVTAPENFLCQDSASTHSCGLLQRDCMKTPGALRTECVFGACEIVMCQEGWRFAVQPDGSAACVVAKPFFFDS